MTWTLAIDTSHVVAVGLAFDGEPRVRVVVDDTRAHAEALMPSVLSACEQAGIRLQDVSEVVVGMGPGPFTGLRVGVATAFTLAHVAGIEPHRVCSLDVVALQVAPSMGGDFVVAVDARRKELYWAQYSREGVRRGEPQVSAPNALPALPVAGVVPEAYQGELSVVNPTTLDPALMAARWRELPVAGDEPYYLRPADATVPGAPKSALPRLRATR